MTKSEKSNLFDEVCKQALVEDAIRTGEVRERKAERRKHREERLEMEEGESALRLVNPYSSAYVVNVHDEPVIISLFESGDPNVRATSGKYAITYLPKASIKRKYKPYRFSQDMLHININVGGTKEFNALCDRIPELGWIRRNTFYSDSLFYVARMHPGIPIRFNIDLVRYCNMLQEKIKARDLPWNAPLVACACSAEKALKYKDKLLEPQPGKERYMKEFEEADKYGDEQ